MLVNPCVVGGGLSPEKGDVGSFASADDNRSAFCHFRSVIERKVNMSFSFDPKTLLCGSCVGKGEHSVTGGEGGARQTFVLSDQNFPACLPCSMGECFKIIRVEDGSLNELVTCFLEVTQGKDLPPGSALVIFSASHLLMAGMGGYLSDLAGEMARIDHVFRGGVISVPGIPVLLGGTSDAMLTRAILEVGGWLATVGSSYPKEAWEILREGIVEDKRGGVVTAEKFKQRVPDSLKHPRATRSWVSGGWATPCGVHPVTPEKEKQLIGALIKDLNGLFNLGLCPEPEKQ